jgi:hypothetical protein
MSDPEVAESVERTKEPDYRAKMIGMGYQFYK